jgi:sugar lactone lactonase YvrE
VSSADVEIAIPASPDTRPQLGEGPTWDPVTGRLLWVDILGCEIHTYDPVTGQDAARATEQHVGAVKPCRGGGLVVNLRDGIGLYGPDGSFHWLAELAEDGVRGNDAAVAPDGALWAGTMRYDEGTGGGRLYRVDGGGDVVTVLGDVTISNGTGWSPDGRLMYYIDTPTSRVDVFDVDVDGVTVTGRRPVAEIGPVGHPDGLTVDADGCVWAALWGGGRVHRYTPSGRLDRVIELPATLTTACAFGGPDLRDLYVTTATVGLTDDQLATEQPHAGSVFVLPGAGQGLPLPAFDDRHL